MSDFRNSTVYQIYVRSFRDSNGDGIGDLAGITEKLPYIRELGADYVWITPFYRSPMRDNGYDIADYYSVDPVFGTMEDAENMLKEADRLGLKLMFDMVFNHPSTEHEWFQKALTGDPEYMDYYIFRDPVDGHEPTNWVSKFGGNAWEYVPSLGKYYLHLFDRTQADLNWENPKVRAELVKVLKFWKEKGVGGFRFDVVNLISKPAVFSDDTEGDGRRFYTDGPHVHEYLKELVREAGITDMLTVGEMSSTSLENCIRYTNPKERELKMAFSFHHLKVDYRNGDKWALMAPDYAELTRLFRTWQEGMQDAGGWNAVFWCNHDQPRILSRMGDEGQYRKESAKMLATLIHLMRGTPYVYQGEEIGMTNTGFTSIDSYRDVESINYYRILLDEGKTEEEALEILGARSRDNGRTPMQWTGEPHAGFSDCEPWLGIPDNYREVNTETEMADPDSIYHYYRKLIRLRKESELIADGSIRFLDTGDPEIIAYERALDGRRLTVVCNLTGREKRHGLALPCGMNRLIGNYENLPDTGILRPYECFAVE